MSRLAWHAWQVDAGRVGAAAVDPERRRTFARDPGEVIDVRRRDGDPYGVSAGEAVGGGEEIEDEGSRLVGRERSSIGAGEASQRNGKGRGARRGDALPVQGSQLAFRDVRDAAALVDVLQIDEDRGIRGRRAHEQ